MKLITDNITLQEIKEMANPDYDDLVKAVVDIEKEIAGIDAELHADLESLLLENNSEQENLWGINLYPHKPQEQWIEFDSLINIRPWKENFSRGVENPDIRNRIIQVVNKLVRQ